MYRSKPGDGAREVSRTGRRGTKKTSETAVGHLLALQLVTHSASRCFAFRRSRSGIWFLLRFLFFVRVFPRTRGITISRLWGFTWFWDRTCRIDWHMFHRADFYVGLVFCEELLPVDQTLQRQQSRVSWTKTLRAKQTRRER